MLGLWIRTWHEDKEITPGVPDLSYVIIGGYETGWLELKAVEESDKFQFEIEPSQHQWIEAHCEWVPVHFLAAVGNDWFVVPGRYHKELAQKMNRYDLLEFAILHVKWPLMPADKLVMLETFKTLTRRNREEVQRV